MRISIFASGSSGNCTLVSYAGTHVLIDAGISMKRIASCIFRLGLLPEDISAVLVTHAHADHINGLQTMTKRHKIPVFATNAVQNGLYESVPEIESCAYEIRTEAYFQLGALEIMAFDTPHDYPGSVGYRIQGDMSFGFCTDLGHVCEQVEKSLLGVDTALIEANHDINMLKYGNYPYYLKKRILSEKGHLSNNDCGVLAAQLAQSGTKTIILGHLSRENNSPELALQEVSKTLTESGAIPGGSVRVDIAPSSGIHIFTNQEKSECLA